MRNTLAADVSVPESFAVSGWLAAGAFRAKHSSAGVHGKWGRHDTVGNAFSTNIRFLKFIIAFRGNLADGVWAANGGDASVFHTLDGTITHAICVWDASETLFGTFCARFWFTALVKVIPVFVALALNPIIGLFHALDWAINHAIFVWDASETLFGTFCARFFFTALVKVIPIFAALARKWIISRNALPTIVKISRLAGRRFFVAVFPGAIVLFARASIRAELR